MNRHVERVKFVVSDRDDNLQGDHIVLRPERGVTTVNVGIWLGAAALLWSLMVIPALVI